MLEKLSDGYSVYSQLKGQMCKNFYFNLKETYLGIKN